MTTPTPEEAIIDDVALWRGPGWVAYCPARSANAGAAVILIGNRHIGWTRVMTLTGPDRFERAAVLVKRYNAFDNTRVI